MAKMKIFEIARSIQQQDKSIKSGDLVKLLNENGFEVKGPNSNIEDDAIAFLMKYFMNKKKEKAEAPEKTEEIAAAKKPEEKKEEAVKPEEKKEDEKKPAPEKEEKKKPLPKQEEEKKPPVKAAAEKNTAGKKTEKPEEKKPAGQNQFKKKERPTGEKRNNEREIGRASCRERVYVLV